MNASPTILVVDDDPAILLGLKLKISRHGYQVVTAQDGNEGLKMANTHKPDLVLSDVMMPFPDGFEMRRLLSQDVQLRVHSIHLSYSPDRGPGSFERLQRRRG